MRRLRRSYLSARKIKDPNSVLSLLSYELDDAIDVFSEKISRPYHVLASRDTDIRLLALLRGLKDNI